MELVVFIIAAAALTVIGIRIGMLVAPRIDRWITPRESRDEDASPDDNA